MRTIRFPTGGFCPMRAARPLRCAGLSFPPPCSRGTARARRRGPRGAPPRSCSPPQSSRRPCSPPTYRACNTKPASPPGIEPDPPAMETRERGASRNRSVVVLIQNNSPVLKHAISTLGVYAPFAPTSVGCTVERLRMQATVSSPLPHSPTHPFFERLRPRLDLGFSLCAKKCFCARHKPID